MDWTPPGADRLWLYNLHYFDGLRATGTPLATKLSMVESWIDHHTDPQQVGWDSYPLSLRIVNWIKWIATDDVVSRSIDRSLAMQLRRLEANLEYHLLGNHLLANAKALMFGGLFFEGPEADHWYRMGLRVLHEQLPEQQLSDGGHYERSPMYHAIFCEDLLDLVNVHRMHKRSPPDWIVLAAERALRWQVVMTGPDGEFPLLNDSAKRVAPGWAELKAYATRMGIEVALPAAHHITHLEETGYVRGRTDRFDFFVDVGPPGPSFLPAHGHCDALSMILYLDGEPLLIDTGTSTYECGTRRDHERGTAAHNTVQIDGREQNELWGSFRMARRSRIEGVDLTSSGLSATVRHFGRAGPRHHRRVEWTATDLRIIDEVSSRADEQCVARFHLPPGLDADLSGVAAELGPARLVFAGADQVRLRPYRHAPEFNHLVDAIVVEATFSSRLVTIIEPTTPEAGRDG